jgi:DNA-binding beta-propeller fold protein YncE
MKLVAVVVLTVALVCAQAPAGKLAELQAVLKSAADPGAVMIEIARQYAAAGDRKQALQWLKKAASRNPEFDPALCRGLETMAAMPELRALAKRARRASPPVRHSQVAFTVAENDLIPEGLAYDPASRKLYLSSVNRRKIVEIAPDGSFRDFATERQDGLGHVFGMKVDARTNTLWATSLSNEEGSGVFHYDLATGRLIRKYVIAADLLFNDLVVSSSGDVFVTATRAEALYWIAARTDRLVEWRPGLKLARANGIALSGDEKKLFVSTFPDGVTVIDRESGYARPLARPAKVSLSSIDGLYFYGNSLIAVQNGCIAHRVARIFLNPALDRVEKVEVLERGNPLFDIPTTGAVGEGAFYYIANSQLHNYGANGIVAREKLRPISILKLKL